jgi:hypothetical protein
MARSTVFQRSDFASAFLLVASGVFIAGCATTRVQAEWRDPQFAGRSLRGAKVLVVCDAKEAAIKRICEDEIAAQVGASGATPVTGPETTGLTVGPPPTNDKTLAAARSAGAKAILGTTIAPDATVVSPGPSVGFGIGGFGGSGSFGTGVGVGVGVPVGAGQVRTAYAADMVLTDVDTVRVIWTSKVTTPASNDVNAQVGDLAKVGVEAARKSGVF